MTCRIEIFFILRKPFRGNKKALAKMNSSKTVRLCISAAKIALTPKNVLSGILSVLADHICRTADRGGKMTQGGDLQINDTKKKSHQAQPEGHADHGPRSAGNP